MSVDPHDIASKKPRTGRKGRRSQEEGLGGLNAGLHRHRVWRACESCRRKKVKCDGVEPICGQCLGTSSQCIWKDTTDRAAHSRQYVQQLENRLHQMESIFQQVAPVVEALGNAPNGVIQPTTPVTTVAKNWVKLKAEHAQAPVPPPMEVDDHDSDVFESDESGDESDEEDVAQKFGQLTHDENGHLRWIGGASTMSLVDSFRSLSRRPAQPESPGDLNVNVLLFPPSIGIGKVRSWALPATEDVEYPPRDLSDKLVSAYFERFHDTLPVLDKITFLQKYKDLMEHDTFRSDTGFLSTVFAVFACAARFVPDSRLTDEGTNEGGLATTFYERAMILHFIGATKTQVAHVQCVVLLASFLASWNCLPQSWLLLGQAVRTAQDLGLHRSAAHMKLPPLEKEMQKRIWWCAYGLDRMLAIALGRPLGIEDSDCDVELPEPLDDEALHASLSGQPATTSGPCFMDGFIALTRLYTIGGHMLRQVYAIDKMRDSVEAAHVAALQASVDRLDSDLAVWCDTLPPQYRTAPVGPRQEMMAAVLCTTYYAILISLHRVFLPSARRRSLSPTSTSVPKAMAAAQNCIVLAKAVGNRIPPSHHLAFFIQYLFTSAVIILLGVLQATDEERIQRTLNEVGQCAQSLASLEQAWPGAKKCRELLEELCEVTKENIRKRAKKERGGHDQSSVRKARRHSKTSASPGELPSRKAIRITPPSEPRPMPPQPSRPQGQPSSSAQLPPTSARATTSAPQSFGQGAQHLQSVPAPGSFSGYALQSLPYTGVPLPSANPSHAAPVHHPSSSTRPSFEAAAGHKRSRQESEADSNASQSYMGSTFAVPNDPGRQVFAQSQPVPFMVPGQGPPNFASSSTAPTGQRHYTGIPYEAPPSVTSITPGLTQSNASAFAVQQDWSTGATQESRSSPSRQTPPYTPSPSSSHVPTSNMPNIAYLNNATSAAGTGPYNSIDFNDLTLPGFDVEMVHNLAQGWPDVPMDTSWLFDPSTLYYDPDTFFPFPVEPSSDSQP